MAGYSEKNFEKLASESPERLVDLLRSGNLAPADLTYAAEIAGRINDRELVVPVLLSLIKHHEPIVREGAIYGLSHYLPDKSIESKLRDLSINDSSAEVKAAAKEALPV